MGVTPAGRRKYPGGREGGGAKRAELGVPIAGLR